MSSITFSGLGSGLPISDWIDALIAVEQTPIDNLYTKLSNISTSETTLNTLESKFSSLRSAIEDITDSNIVSAFDLFGRKQVTSSDSSIATATVSNKAAVQKLTLKVESLATATVASSASSPGATATGSTSVADIGGNTSTDDDVTGLTFSLFVNNEQYTYTLDKDGSTTLDEIADMINSDFSSGEVTASVTSDGKFKIDVDNSTVTSFVAGANTDTSNFLTVAQLKKVALDSSQSTSSDNIDYMISSNSLTTMDTTGTLVGNNANLVTEVTAGTFKIGDEEFTIDSTTTLSGIVSAINASDDAGVTAVLDKKSNKIILTSTNPGALGITIEAGTSNFTDVMGLTSDGKIADGSQVLGDNAVVELNGTTIEASTNVLTADNTGITGLTINLLGVTADDEDDGETEVTLNVLNDTDDLTTALESFITKFNDFCDLVNTETATDGDLKGEYTLLRLKAQLRSILTSSVAGADSDYNNVSTIGITSGDAGLDVSDTSNELSIDSDTLLEALSNNPEAVRDLLIGDSSKGITGVLQQLESLVEGNLDLEYGYFAARQTSYENQYSDISDKITEKEDALEAYRERLTAKFTAMDTLIAQLQASSSALLG